ncbi:MAG: hypothetical protein GX134_04215 [candidate division WS1 bacterium]|jgi:hypothetical protein|nr:hypothetical protein [candidate division WS1 bacterium]
MRIVATCLLIGLVGLGIAGIAGCEAGYSGVSISLGIAGRSASGDGVHDLDKGLLYNLTWEVRSSNGDLIDRELKDFSWGVSNSNVVRIDRNTGRIEARNLGTATVTAILTDSNVTGTMYVRVN